VKLTLMYGKYQNHRMVTVLAPRLC